MSSAVSQSSSRAWAAFSSRPYRHVPEGSVRNTQRPKTPLPAADLLNDRVVAFFGRHGIRLSRVLIDRGTEYFGSSELHEYEMYLAMENVPHTRTWARSLQTNGIVERLRKTMLNGLHRRKIYDSIPALQTDLDVGLDRCNNGRQHQGRWCYGKTPMCTFLDSLEFAKEQLITHFAYPTTRQVKSRLIHFSDSGTFASRPSLQHGGYTHK